MCATDAGVARGLCGRGQTHADGHADRDTGSQTGRHIHTGRQSHRYTCRPTYIQTSMHIYIHTGRWTESLEMTNKILEMINRGEIKQGMKMEVMIMRGNILESMEQIAGAIEQIQVFCTVM